MNNNKQVIIIIFKNAKPNRSLMPIGANPNLMA